MTKKKQLIQLVPYELEKALEKSLNSEILETMDVRISVKLIKFDCGSYILKQTLAHILDGRFFYG